MKLAVLDIDGKEVRKLDVDDSVFGIEPNGAVLHQAYVRHRNNQRRGTANTKTRGEVQGSTRKIRMQKYTGRARQGSSRSPTRVGGGTIFGPHQRDYSQDMPKKMRRLAIRSALSGKVADGQMVVIDQLAFEKPKTQEMIRIFENVGFERSVLVVTADSDRTVLASIRNLDRTKALPAAYLNVADMLNHAGLLITEEAVRIAEGLWGKKDAKDGVKLARRGQTSAAPAEAPKKRAARAPAAEAEAEEPAPKPRRGKAPVAEAEAEATPVEATVEAAPEKPKKAARTRKAAAKAEAPAAEAVGEAKTEEKPKRARAKKPAAKVEKPATKAKKPAAKASAVAAKPKTTAKAAKPAAAASDKPKRARAKKTEETE
jgi:large subunit ribosomal protein L4